MVRGNQSNTVEEIKDRCNIVDVIGRVVPLKKAGSNYKGLCPFHNEKTPSFVVSETKQIFTCFGCGQTGNVIGFVSKYYNLDFRGAVEQLAREYGIDISGTFRDSGRKNELYEVNRLAARYFYRSMRQRMNPGYAYMKHRGISEEIMNRFGIGYADDQWRSLLEEMERNKVSRDKLKELGLISQSEGRAYDKFRGRVIFPIQNAGGKVIGFGGRILGEGNPKYLNSQESVVFQKKNNLYGLNLAKQEIAKEDRIILVEGYMDVISLHQAGIRNVCASLGTALTEQQARLIRRYTKRVVLSYDADEAGQNAAMRGIDILYAEGLDARVLKVTDGKDPDEFIQRNGRKDFLDLIEEALPYGDFKMHRIGSKYDLNVEQQKLSYIREMIQVLRSMRPVDADLYIRKLSQQTGISERAIRMEYGGGLQEDERRPAAQTTRETQEDSGELSEAELNLLKLILISPGFAVLPEDIQKLAFQGSDGKTLLEGCVEYSGRGRAGIEALGQKLEPDLTKILRRVDAMVIPPDKEEAIYNDCIRFLRREELLKQDQEITLRLTLADESIGDEQLRALMQRQAEIQKKLKG